MCRVIETKTQNKTKKMSDTVKRTGTIYKVGKTQTFESGFTKREFVLKVDDGKYPQLLKMEFVKDRISQLDGHNPGDEVTASFNIRGRESDDGRVWNSLVAWQLDEAQKPTNDPGENYSAKVEAADDGDEIPF
jgi:hypothetical protein